jgi:hypothetical protein
VSKLAQQGITYAAANEIELVSGIAEQLAQPVSDRCDSQQLGHRRGLH